MPRLNIPSASLPSLASGKAAQKKPVRFSKWTLACVFEVATLQASIYSKSTNSQYWPRRSKHGTKCEIVSVMDYYTLLEIDLGS